MKFWTVWFLWFGLAVGVANAEQRNESPAGAAASIVDVRELIKEALGVMRSYSPPTELIQAPTQMNPIIRAPVQSQPLPQAPAAYYPRRALGSTTYNGGIVSDVDRRFGVMADSQPDVSQQMSRWFAPPTPQDMERLFHLPADIVTRLATDAGYIRPGEEEQPSYSTSSSSSSSSDGGGLSSFDFNLSGRGENGQDLPGFIASLQNGTINSPPSTPAPEIKVPGPPKIATRQIMRDGKLVAVPLLIIPQANGPDIQVPFADMRDLSDTVNRIISTGKFKVTTTAAPTAEPIATAATLPADVQIEPTTRKPAVSPGGSRSAFVQQFDDEAAAENSAKTPKTTMEPITSTTARKTTTTTKVKTTTTPEPEVERVTEKAAAEIVLDGRRYKLVAVESSETSSPTTVTEKTTKSSTTIATEMPAVSVVRTSESRTFHVEKMGESAASSEDQSTTAFRPPTLRELEERYNRENALAKRGESDDKTEEEISDESNESNGQLLRHHRTRLLALRTPISIRKPKPGETIKTHIQGNSRCAILRAFSHKFGVADLHEFALQNCEFLENYDPSLRCSDVATFVANCERELIQ